MTSPEVPELLSFDLTLDELEFVAVGIVYLIERLEFLRDRKQTTALDVQISRGYKLVGEVAERDAVGGPCAAPGVLPGDVQ